MAGDTVTLHDEHCPLYPAEQTELCDICEIIYTVTLEQQAAAMGKVLLLDDSPEYGNADSEEYVAGLFEGYELALGKVRSALEPHKDTDEVNDDGE